MNTQSSPRTKQSPRQKSAFDTAIDEGIASKHVRITNHFWKTIRTRGTKLARQLSNRAL